MDVVKKMKMVADSLIGFSPAPVRFVEIFGALFALGATIWALLLFVLRITGTLEAVEGWTALMIVLLFSSGAIMLSLGILGEYIWRTFDVSQNRPVYIVDEKVDSDKVK